MDMAISHTQRGPRWSKQNVPAQSNRHKQGGKLGNMPPPSQGDDVNTVEEMNTTQETVRRKGGHAPTAENVITLQLSAKEE
ncbi:hypothetical protein NDU88_008108 [Pleurodeles waltl]|uniref:Uncharacterized protein n=1 Tax=Pleurodeles waltl TaxID=8319 RepID=A0AAV7VWA1_PLEWA|nr:hypothetical protein NDU88_008108 [Pleurodeles waltl]